VKKPVDGEGGDLGKMAIHLGVHHPRFAVSMPIQRIGSRWIVARDLRARAIV
jgi:hypothetical protein